MFVPYFALVYRKMSALNFLAMDTPSYIVTYLYYLRSHLLATMAKRIAP